MYFLTFVDLWEINLKNKLTYLRMVIIFELAMKVMTYYYLSIRDYLRLKNFLYKGNSMSRKVKKVSVTLNLPSDL